MISALRDLTPSIKEVCLQLSKAGGGVERLHPQERAPQLGVLH